MKNKTVSLLQMALRAGKTVRGDGLLPGISSGKVLLTVASDDLGNNTRKKLQNKSATAGVPLLWLDPLQFNEISQKAGKAYGVTDQGFADAILKAQAAFEEASEKLNKKPTEDCQKDSQKQ